MSGKSSPTLNNRAAELVQEMVSLQFEVIELNLLLDDPTPNKERLVIAGNQMLDLAQVSLSFGMSQDYAKSLENLGKVLLYVTNSEVMTRDYQTAKANYLIYSTFRKDYTK